MASPRRRVALAPDVVLQVIGEEALLVKLDRETVFSLNATGAAVVRRLATPQDLSGLVEAVAREYGVAPSDIDDDVMRLLESLAAAGLVLVEPPMERRP